MTHHPHVHMIVPGGGISADGWKWISSCEDFLLPVPVLKRLFRAKMLAMLKAVHAAGKLQFFNEHAHLADAAAFKAFLGPLYHIKWHVYAKRPFAGPEAVLAYLARYTHRVAISNSRLISIDERAVTFTFKDYRITGPGRYKTMTLEPGEFMRRFLLHVLPKGFHRIRHYGLLASSRTKADTMARARELIAVAAPAQPPQPTKRMQATARHRGDRQADPSLPVLRWSHDHHRDVRGRLDAATSPDRVGDRDQDRHVMTPIAPRSPDNAAGLCCWSMSGNDDARPQSLSDPCNRPRKASDPAFSTLVWPTIAPTPLIRGVNARCTGPLLHAQCRANSP